MMMAVKCSLVGSTAKRTLGISARRWLTWRGWSVDVDDGRRSTRGRGAADEPFGVGRVGGSEGFGVGGQDILHTAPQSQDSCRLHLQTTEGREKNQLR